MRKIHHGSKYRDAEALYYNDTRIAVMYTTTDWKTEWIVESNNYCAEIYGIYREGHTCKKKK